MSSSNPNYNARRGYGIGDQQPQHHHLQSGLRRSHLHGSRGTTFNFSADSDNKPAPNTITNHSRIDGPRPSHTDFSRATINHQSQAKLPTASEYFAQEATSLGGAQSGSPSAPWARPGNRFSRLPSNSYGLPPTPESDVSVSRLTTPPRQHRDHHFNVDMMQRMTQHAKISPLNQYGSLQRELAEDNLVVDNGNVDRLVARAGERVSGGASRGYEGTSGEPTAARRVAFRSPEAVEGAREASRRLNGASTIDRPNSMYEGASKPVEPNHTSNMYADLKRTLSESSSERPKRVIRPVNNQRKLPPLSPVQRRHVEVRPRRPTGTSDSHTPSPQQNDYYPQEPRPKIASSQDDQVNNIDWLAAAQDANEAPLQKSAARRRTRASSSGTPLAASTKPTRRSEEFGGELRPDPTDIRVSLTANQPASTSSASQTTSRPSPPRKQVGAPSTSYLKHELVDFVSEDDLTINLSPEKTTGGGFGGARSRVSDATTSRRPETSGGSKPQEVSFLQSNKSTDPDETLDTLRQLSRLLSGNTPAKDEGRRIVELASAKAVEVKRAVSNANAAESRQPYKHQTRPVARRLIPDGGEHSRMGLDLKTSTPGQQSRSTFPRSLGGSSQNQSVSQSLRSQSLPLATPHLKKPKSKQPTESKTPTSKSIQFEDGYETDDSLDRLLTHDTDYASLLKPAVYEDESFLHGTIQVASQSQASKTSDLEALALRTKVLNNLQTVQLDIRETRRGLESIERKFGILEDDGMFSNIHEKKGNATIAPAESTPLQRRVLILSRRKQRSPGKGLFRTPWSFKDYFSATLLIMLGIVAIEYKLWSDTIIPEFSKISSDEWFATHPAGSYKPGATLRVMVQVVARLGNVGLYCIEHVLTFSLWILSGIQWLEVRVMDAILPPPEYQPVETLTPTVATALAEPTMETVETILGVPIESELKGLTSEPSWSATFVTTQGITSEDWKPPSRRAKVLLKQIRQVSMFEMGGQWTSLVGSCYGQEDTVITFAAVEPRNPEWVMKTCVYSFPPMPDGSLLELPERVECSDEVYLYEIPFLAALVNAKRMLCRR
ncbi:hypothetical protein AA313_de0201278 [Arthrobotrys entomopaga]|nr:hypothetical protein AA313_de0201278 [Arthrobotrys entomopaga]